MTNAEWILKTGKKFSRLVCYCGRFYNNKNYSVIRYTEEDGTHTEVGLTEQHWHESGEQTVLRWLDEEYKETLD